LSLDMEHESVWDSLGEESRPGGALPRGTAALVRARGPCPWSAPTVGGRGRWPWSVVVVGGRGRCPWPDSDSDSDAAVFRIA